MKRRILTVLTALALCLSLCPVTVLAAGNDTPSTKAAGTPTRTERLDLYTMDEATENAAEGWKWEPGTCTLTLTDCYIKMGHTLIIRFPDSEEAHLVLEGNNIIETSSTSYNYIIGSESGKMKHLKVKGNGSLTVTATTAGGDASNAPYIFASQALTIEDGATINSNMQLCVINNNFTLNGGSVTLKGEYVGYGIYVNAGNIIIKDGYLDISDGTLCMYLPGIPATPRTSNVEISGGIVKLQAKVATVYSAQGGNQTDDTDNLVITGGNVQIFSPLRVRKISVTKGANLTLNTTNGLVINSGYNIGAKLAGGTYTGSAAAVQIINRDDQTLADLLAEGYAFYKGSVSRANLVTDTTGTSLTGTIVVDKCVHTPLTSNKNGTHGGKCTACGQSFESNPCTYEFTTSGNVYTGVCSTCGSVVKITVTGTDNLVYNGIEQKPSVSVTLDDKELTQGTDYTVTVSSKDAGDVTARIAGTGSYQFTKTCTFSIAPKPLTVTGATATSRDYDGTKEVAVTAVALDGVVGGDTVSVDCSNLKGTISSADVGTYTSVTLPELTLTGAAAGNYTLTQPTGAVTASVIISKGTYAGTKTAETSGKFGVSKTFDLGSLLPDGATVGAAPVTSGNDIFTETPSVSGEVLSYTLVNDENKVGATAEVKVTVSSPNYTDFDFVITVTVADKYVPTLTVSPITVTYSGEAVPGTAIKGTAKVGDTTVVGTWSFKEGQALTDVADSGTKAVLFTPDDAANYAAAEGIVSVTINKATPTGAPKYTAISASGKTLADAELTAEGGTFSTTGTLAWSLPGDTAVAANTAYEWTFTPSDTANYNTLTGNITLWVQSTSGGSTQTTPPVTTDKTTEGGVSATETTAKPSATTKGGTATTNVSTSVGNEIVKQAEKNNSGSVVIAPEIKGDVTKTEVSIPASTVGEIGSKTEASLTISTPVADVTIPNGGLGSLASEGGTVSVTAEVKGNAVELSVTAGGKTVDSIPGGVTVTVPVEETKPGTVAVLVKEDGTRQVIRKSAAGENGVTVPLDGSAKIEIVDNGKVFSDVPSDNWAADAVAFASAHELFNGTSDTTFSPDLPMSRGMLAVVLHNLESNPDVVLGGAFSDVSDSKWYAEGVSWAAAKGIITGYGNGTFGPDDDITREQLAVMLWRYAGSPAATDKELQFADAGKASGYALDALRWAVGKGIINGKGNGILDPGGKATRAETAQMLKNFLENK